MYNQGGGYGAGAYGSAPGGYSAQGGYGSASGGAGGGAAGGGAGGPPPPPFGVPPAASPYASSYGGGVGVGLTGPSMAMAGGGAQVSRRGSAANDDNSKLGKDPILSLSRWFKSRSPKERLALLAVAGVVVSWFRRWSSCDFGGGRTTARKRR
jgi:hypothetical protein